MKLTGPCPRPLVMAVNEFHDEWDMKDVKKGILKGDVDCTECATACR